MSNDGSDAVDDDTVRRLDARMEQLARRVAYVEFQTSKIIEAGGSAAFWSGFLVGLVIIVAMRRRARRRREATTP